VVKIIKIEEWMSKPVISVKKDMTIKEIIKLMDQHNIGAIPVCEDGKPTGIITERDILRRVLAKELNIDQMKATDIMTKNPVTIPYNSTILEVTRLMSENNFRRLLVVKNDKLIGIVTAKDVIEVMST
jgi:CBS domain-containing protein